MPVKCRNGTVTDYHLPRGPSRLHLSPGCEATFLQHHVFADLSIKMPAETLHLEWEWDPLDLLHMPQMDIKQELQHLREFGIHRPILTDLQYRSAELQQGSWNKFSHLLHFVGNAVLAVILIGLFVRIFYRCHLWRRSRCQNQILNPQPRLQRANEPLISAAAAARLMGVNNPFERGLQQRYLEPLRQNPTAPQPEPAVRFNVDRESVNLNAEPYADQHQRVRSELERQALQKHHQAQINRLSQLPVVPDHDSDND